MKDILWLNYNLKITSLNEYPRYSSFEWQKDTYYFTKLMINENDFQELLIIVNELLTKNYPVYPFIKNINGSFITKVKNDNFVLLKVTESKKEISFLDMIKLARIPLINKKVSSLNRDNWGELWSKKEDYLEYQISELGKNYPIILEVFSYYAGLVENAISYANHVIKEKGESNIYLAHRRVISPNYYLNAYNPLNFIFDLKVRDIAEYLKSEALEDPKYALIDLKSYLSLEPLTHYEASMLYARLLYPSYYLDLHEKIMNKEIDEKAILKIVDKINDMELFLNNAYILISKYIPIEKVMWLEKKEL